MLGAIWFSAPVSWARHDRFGQARATRIMRKGKEKAPPEEAGLSNCWRADLYLEVKPNVYAKAKGRVVLKCRTGAICAIT